MNNIRIIITSLFLTAFILSCDTDGGTSRIDFEEGAVTSIDKAEGFQPFLDLIKLDAGEDIEIKFTVREAFGEIEAVDVIAFYRTAEETYGPITLRSNITELPEEITLSGDDIVATFPELTGKDDFALADELILSTRIYLPDGRVIDLLDEEGNRTYGADLHTSTIFNAQASYPVSCPSDLEAEFTWVASDFVLQGSSLGDYDFPSGTGSLVPTSAGATTYVYESGYFDFGYYCVVYNDEEPDCADGAAGSLNLSDICGILSYTGTDQYGDAWEIFDVEVDGAELTFSWTSAYGEGSTVTLTRTDGMEWPENLRTE